MIDDMSKDTFVDVSIPHRFDLKAPRVSYNLNTLNGVKQNILGQLVSGLQVKGVGQDQWIDLPPALSSEFIPDTTHERAVQLVM